MKRKYKKGDLVKNKGSISWRNQEVMGVIIDVKDLPFNQTANTSQVVVVKWLDPAISKDGWESYYNTSVELVAEGK